MSSCAMMLGGRNTAPHIGNTVTSAVKLAAIPLVWIETGEITGGFAEGDVISARRSGLEIGSLLVERLSEGFLIASQVSGEMPTNGDSIVGPSGSATLSLVELFPNPGIESGEVTGWTKESRATIVASTTEQHGGTYSLHLTGGTINNYIIRAISVTPGRPYVFNVWKKGGAATSHARLGTAALGTQYASNVLLGVKSDWTQATVEFVAQTATVYVSLGVGAGNTDGGYWDDFSLMPAMAYRAWADLSFEERPITPSGVCAFSMVGSRLNELAFVGAANGYATYGDLGLSQEPVWFEIMATIESTGEMRVVPCRYPFIQLKAVNRIPYVNVFGSSWLAGHTLVSGQYYRIRGDLVLNPSGGAALRLWIDGELKATLPLAGIPATTNGTNTIAAAYDGTMKWIGKISEFVVGNGSPIPYGATRYTSGGRWSR